MKNKAFDIIKNGLLIFLYAFTVFIIFEISLVMQVWDAKVMTLIGTFAWFVIYLLFPIAVFALTVIFTIKSKPKKSILLSVILILSYAAIAFSMIFVVNSYFSEFSQEKWGKYPYQRYNMLEDMTDEINFMGMSKEEVIDILGNPGVPYADPDGADLIDYYVGSSSIDPTMVTFVFENDKVVEVYEYTEFRIETKSFYED